jgi:hypothetical protein
VKPPPGFKTRITATGRSLRFLRERYGTEELIERGGSGLAFEMRKGLRRLVLCAPRVGRSGVRELALAGLDERRLDRSEFPPNAESGATGSSL